MPKKTPACVLVTRRKRAPTNCRRAEAAAPVPRPAAAAAEAACPVASAPGCSNAAAGLWMAAGRKGGGEVTPALVQTVLLQNRKLLARVEASARAEDIGTDTCPAAYVVHCSFCTLSGCLYFSSLIVCYDFENTIMTITN